MGVYRRVIVEMVCDKEKYMKSPSLSQLLATSERGNNGFRASYKICFLIVKSGSGTPLMKN